MTVTLRRAWLAKTTATVKDTYPGFRLIQTASANWLVGFLMGCDDGTRHLRAIDALLVMSTVSPGSRGSETAALAIVRDYLALHEIAEFTPKPQRRPRLPDERAR